MIAAFVRFALSPTTDLAGALSCFDEDMDSLPLAWRPYGSPRHWSGPCMAGALDRTAAGDAALWPRTLRPAVLCAVTAAREALAGGCFRGLQAAAYAVAQVAHACLFAGDLDTLVLPRLAKQLNFDSTHPLLRVMISAFSSLGMRSSLLALRGATSSVCTGARMQTPGAVCRFCAAPSDSMLHYAACPSALAIFCTALQRPVSPILIQVLEANAARAWAAFTDSASVAVATRSDVVARGASFLPLAASALARAHLAPVDEGGAGEGPRPRLRCRRRAPDS